MVEPNTFTWGNKPPSDPIEGMVIFVTDENAEYVKENGEWVRVTVNGTTEHSE